MARKPATANLDNQQPNGTADNGGSADIVSGVNIFAGTGRITVNPADIAGDGENSGGDGGSGGNTASEPKRRGRKPGSRNKTTAKAAPLDINGVEFILLSAHEMLAALTRQEVFRLDKEEANSLATAVSNVSRHYDVQATEKTIDWIALMMALGRVYGPRLVVLGMTKKKKPDAPADQPIMPTAAASHIPGSIQ